MKKPFYITTTLPYVNAEPHIGHALEFIRADIIARSKKLAGYDVFLNTGTDEHGIKVYQKAKHLHMEPQAYVNQGSEKFRAMLPLLGIIPEANFIRTTDPHHVMAAQEFWKLVKKNGHIYKKNYSVKYCVGCELEKTDSELVDGRCPLHPLQELEIIQEENYFFRFSLFSKQLLDLYERNPTFVIPHTRLNEIRAFVERGLEDFSISRLKVKMPWGIEVPDDSEHVMYVWFDALVDYISAVGWPDDQSKFKKWWVDTGGVVQYCGKDNLRQQSAMWQAMLMAANMTPSKQVIINGFITGEGGVKMSKSMGNTVDPLDIVKEYGTDALRYYVARELGSFEDTPFTADKFKESYNAHLANGIGNLTSRVLKMAETNSVWIDLPGTPVDYVEFEKKFATYEINKVCNSIWEKIELADKYIDDNKPFKAIKEDKQKGEEAIRHLLGELWVIAHLLAPILPETSEAIKKLMIEKKAPPQPLFMRK
jgi:methionyl-tRNA synthetase